MTKGAAGAVRRASRWAREGGIFGWISSLERRAAKKKCAWARTCTRHRGYRWHAQLSNAKGEYRFRTIQPGLYTGRTRHFHIAVNRNGQRLLTTQLYFAGEPQNDSDGVLKRLRDEAQRLSVIREFKPATTGSKEQVATWDIVVGLTPEDPEPRRGAPVKRPQ